MSKIILGLICGVVFGIIDILIMLPMAFEDKKAALAGAFVNRFSIGFIIGAVDLPLASWINGLIFGLLLSLPDAIITKAWAPIMGMGVVGGLVIGLVIGKWGV